MKILGTILFIFVVGLLFYEMTDFASGNYLSCHLESLSSDKYCQATYPSNVSNYKLYQVASHKADFIAEQERQAIKKESEENELKEKQCYDGGYNYQKDLDIIEDYGLSCQKIAYINDHLIDEKVNGGYIKGSYSGFFSYGHVEGNFDIIKGSLATGQLIQNISYHVNCRNETINQQIDYYDESEFVLYYVNKCIGNGEGK